MADSVLQWAVIDAIVDLTRSSLPQKIQEVKVTPYGETKREPSMSIEVSCKSCHWAGTVDDSLAGETIACRTCAEPITIPKQKADFGTDYEMVDGKPPRIAVPEEPPRDPTRVAKAKRKSDNLKQYAVRPEERKWWIPPKVARAVGLLTAFAGLVAFVVDTILTQWSTYPFVLFGIGLVIAIVGHVLVSTTT